MNKKIVISLLLIGIMAFGAGLGTFAWFTATTSSANNVFDTGTLAVNTNAASSGFMNFQNKQPGDSQSATLQIQNTGDLAFKYRVYAQLSGDSVLYNNPNGADRNLKVSITNGTVTKSCDLKDLIAGNAFEVASLGAATNETLTITVSLPQTAGNECQGKTAGITFVIDATQTNNAGWAQ